MRISDWSSDVCSSDLSRFSPRPGKAGGMSKSAHPVAGESRWLYVAGALAAVALAPTAAGATPKLANVKTVTDGKAACPVAANHARQTPADISRTILGGAPSAFDSVRTEQAAAEPLAADR